MYEYMIYIYPSCLICLPPPPPPSLGAEAAKSPPPSLGWVGLEMFRTVMPRLGVRYTDPNPQTHLKDPEGARSDRD